MGFSIIQIPAFDGSSDPLQWLSHCYQYFDAGQIHETMKVMVVSFRMKGAPYKRFCWMEQNVGAISWPSFVDAFSH
jgi:hypothetical protein